MQQYDIIVYVLEKESVVNGDRKYKHIFGFSDNEGEILLKSGNLNGYKIIYKNNTTNQRLLFHTIREIVDVSNNREMLDTEALDHILGRQEKEMLVGTNASSTDLNDRTLEYYSSGDSDAVL